VVGKSQSRFHLNGDLTAILAIRFDNKRFDLKPWDSICDLIQTSAIRFGNRTSPAAPQVGLQTGATEKMKIVLVGPCCAVRCKACMNADRQQPDQISTAVLEKFTLNE